MRRNWLLLAVVAALLVILTAVVEAAHLRPLALDTGIHTWLLDHRDAPLNHVAVAVTRTGVGPVAYALALLAGGLAAARHHWRRRWLGPLAALAALLVVQSLRTTTAQIIDRPRPPTADWVLSAAGPAFPSGHTTTSATVAALFCLAVAGTGWKRSRALVAVVAVAVTWAVAVGLSRLYLGVHWPTDVLGGWLLAAAFALVGAIVVRFRSDSARQADDHDDS